MGPIRDGSVPFWLRLGMCHVLFFRPLNILIVFFVVSYRTGILWVMILALLVPHWMHRAVVSVSRLFVDIFPVVSEDRCLLPAEYIYSPLNVTEWYVPPSEDNLGDLSCDCNTVMYKYEVQALQRGSCADLPFGLKSLHGVYLVSGGPDLLVRPRTAIPLRLLLTTPSRWTVWSEACRNVSISE